MLALATYLVVPVLAGIAAKVLHSALLTLAVEILTVASVHPDELEQAFQRAS